jgi:hypothetical protein
MNDTKKSHIMIGTMTKDHPMVAPGSGFGHQRPAVVSAP